MYANRSHGYFHLDRNGLASPGVSPEFVYQRYEAETLVVCHLSLKREFQSGTRLASSKILWRERVHFLLCQSSLSFSGRPN
jgi:hypothetical protein